MEREQRGLDLGLEGVGLKRALLLLGLVFAIALAVVVGKRMSAEAMAVVVGVVCGVAAGIPTSLLLLLLLSRRERTPSPEEPRAGAGHYPPVVVIQGGAPQALPPGLPAGYWPAPAPGMTGQRQFHVVGDDEWRLGPGEV
jgi:hypothetical protein